MGANLSWLAVEGADPQAVVQRFGLVPEGEASEEYDAEFACTGDSPGWVVLVGKWIGADWPLCVPGPGLRLLGWCYDTTYASGLRAYRKGELQWSVELDPDRDADDLQVEGAPPPPFDEDRRRLEAPRAAPDKGETNGLFDVPLDLSDVICSYRPECSLPYRWTLLRRPPRFAFGRRLPPPPRSIHEAICERLLPQVSALGWAIEDAARIQTPGCIHRTIDGREQTLTIDYRSGSFTYVRLRAEDATRDAVRITRRCLSSFATPADGSRRRRLWAPRGGSPDEAIAQAIEAAGRQLADIDAMLRDPAAPCRPGITERPY